MKSMKACIALVAATLLALTGCDRNATTAATTTVTEPMFIDGVLVTGDADLAVIDVLPPGTGSTAFDCVFDEIDVDVLMNRIVIKITIDDDTYRNYQYVTRMSPVSGDGKTVTSYLRKEATVTTHTLVYEHFAGSGSYQFFVAKYYEYLNLPSTVFVEPAASFTIRIPSWNDRKHLAVGSFAVKDYNQEQDENMYTELGRTNASLTIAFGDPDLAVETVKVAFYEVETGRLVAAPVFDAGTVRDANGFCRLEGKVVTGLSPGVAYHVYILVSGNDGINDFNDRTVAERVIETDAFWGTDDSAHGMYAYIVPGNVTASGLRFTVNFQYDGMTFAAGTETPIAFVVRIRDEDGGILFEEPVEASGRLSFFAGNENLRIGAEISVESVDGTVRLCGFLVPFEPPTVNVVLGGSSGSRTITIYWNPKDGVITGGSIAILFNQTVMETYDFSEWSSALEVTFPFDAPSNYVDFGASIYISYTAFDGNDTGTVSYMTWPI